MVIGNKFRPKIFHVPECTCLVAIGIFRAGFEQPAPSRWSYPRRCIVGHLLSRQLPEAVASIEIGRFVDHRSTPLDMILISFICRDHVRACDFSRM